MRDHREITSAEAELTDSVWHERHLVLMAEDPDRTGMAEAERAAKAIRQELGAGKVGPYTDFEWGELNGNCPRFGGFLGDEWDRLDT